MVDLMRTNCGRIPNPEELMFRLDHITSFYKRCYKNRFRPFIPVFVGFVRNLTGYHSEMNAVSKNANSSKGVKQKTVFEEKS